MEIHLHKNSRNVICIWWMHSSYSVRGSKEQCAAVVFMNPAAWENCCLRVLTLFLTPYSFHGLFWQNSHVFNLYVDFFLSLPLLSSFYLPLCFGKATEKHFKVHWHMKLWAVFILFFLYFSTILNFFERLIFSFALLPPKIMPCPFNLCSELWYKWWFLAC